MTIKWIIRLNKKKTIPVAFILFSLMVVCAPRVEALSTDWGFDSSPTHQISTTPTLSFSPAASSVPIGSQVSVDIVVVNVSDLYGISVDIHFDPNLVAVVDMDSGKAGVQITPGSCPSHDFVAKNSTNNTAGLIEYDVTSLSPSEPCNGNGTIATITFEGIANGNSTLHLESWLLSDPDGIEISAEATDGSILVGELNEQTVFLPLILKSGAVGETVLKFSPSSSSVGTGDQVTVDIAVENVSDLYGIALDIIFDPSLMAVVDMDSGAAGVQITPGSCPSPDFVVKNSTNNVTGLIEYDVISLAPSAACNGSGTIATITFEGIAVGTSGISFDSWLLSDTNGIAITVAAEDGTIEVTGQGGTIVRFNPSSSSVGVGSNVMVDIVVENVSDLYGISLDISFDPNLVVVVDSNSGTAGVQITPGSCLSPDFTVKNNTNNTTGLIEYDVITLAPSAPCNGSGTIATITFEGIATGTSAISFDAWLLSDPDGLEITAIAQDGSIQVTD